MGGRSTWHEGSSNMPGEGPLLADPCRRLVGKPPSVSLGQPRWMLSHLDPHAAQAYQGRAIHSEGLNSRLAAGSKIKHERSISVPDKVLFPEPVLRVEQGHSMTKQGSDGCSTRGFRAVTGRTSQAQIIKNRFATCAA